MYDPISDNQIPSHHTKPDSFWESAQKLSIFSPISSTTITDIVVVGAGFTGLSAALHLAETYKRQVTVIEANQPGWGASGRNGGFVLPGTGRLGVQDLTKKWGKTTAQAIYKDYLASVNSVQALIDKGIECDYSQGGYLKLAHNPTLLNGLHQQANLLSDDFSDKEFSENIRPLNAKQVAQDYLKGTNSFGGIYFPNAFSVNPWMFCQGLAQQAVKAGVEIFGNSAVTKFEYLNNQHCIHTNSGLIKAKTLVLATNAYGLRKLHPAISDRMFPVMSSILVTKPLNGEQLSSIGMRDGLMVMDTRPLKYYYRLLPDKRLLFGGRGPINGKDANNEANQKMLLRGLQDTFPSVAQFDIAHFWSGWVSVSLDNYPRIYHDKKQNILYSGGYCGAGLAFSVQAGKRLAQLLCEPSALPALPYWQTPLRPFPLASLRRPALRFYYACMRFGGMT